MTNIWINVYNAIWSLRLIRRLGTFLQILSLKRRRRWDNSNIVCARVTPQRIAEQRDLNNGIKSNKCVRKSLCVCASAYSFYKLILGDVWKANKQTIQYDILCTIRQYYEIYIITINDYNNISPMTTVYGIQKSCLECLKPASSD